MLHVYCYACSHTQYPGAYPSRRGRVTMHHYRLLKQATWAFWKLAKQSTVWGPHISSNSAIAAGLSIQSSAQIICLLIKFHRDPLRLKPNMVVNWQWKHYQVQTWFLASHLQNVGNILVICKPPHSGIFEFRCNRLHDLPYCYQLSPGRALGHAIITPAVNTSCLPYTKLVNLMCVVLVHHHVLQYTVLRLQVIWHTLLNYRKTFH